MMGRVGAYVVGFAVICADSVSRGLSVEAFRDRKEIEKLNKAQHTIPRDDLHQIGFEGEDLFPAECWQVLAYEHPIFRIEVS